jgi:osmoprotectant transport system permease protein
MARRKRGRVAFGGVGLLLIVSAALLPGAAQTRADYVIGAKAFTEQHVLSALIGQRLSEAGLPSTRREGLGSSVIFDALGSGEIDIYVDYSGTIWSNQIRRNDVKPRAEVLAECKKWLAEKHNITMLGGLGFENAYALAMPRKRADELGIRSIADLAHYAPNFSIAGDFEFFARPEWDVIKKTYGIAFREQRQMQQAFMYAAAAQGEIDVISAYTSDGRIAQYDLLVLDDPKQAIPPYDAILLVAPGRESDQALIRALRPLIDAIDVKHMREANLRATGGGANQSPAKAAQWLWSEIRRQKAVTPK